MAISFTARDGAEFAVEEWAGSRPEAILVCAHGMGGAAGDFAPLGEAAAKAGFGCYAMNLRGQGSDPVPARRGAWLDAEALGAEVAEFAESRRRRHGDVPVFFCGESMGALVVARLLAGPALPFPVAGAVFSVPVVQLKRPTSPVVRWLVRGLAATVPGVRFWPSWFVTGKSAPLRVTRDEAHAAKVRAAPHHLRAFTFRFLHNLGRLIESSDVLAAQIRVPSLVLAAGQDVFLTPEQVLRWFEKIPAADKTFLLYPEAFHLLWNDWDSEHVLRDVMAWLDARAAVSI